MKNFASRFLKPNLPLNAVAKFATSSKTDSIDEALNNYVSSISKDVIFPAYYRISKDFGRDLKEENFRKEVETLGKEFREHIESNKVSSSVINNLYSRPFVVFRHSQFLPYEILNAPFERILGFSPEDKDQVEKTYQSYCRENLLPNGWSHKTLEDFMAKTPFIAEIRAGNRSYK